MKLLIKDGDRFVIYYLLVDELFKLKLLSGESGIERSKGINGSLP